MKRTVVTGANGFLGQAVVKRLARDGWKVCAATRDGCQVAGASEQSATGDLLSADLPKLVAGASVVVNCAARVHVLSRENAQQAERHYQAMNVEFPLRLAKAARKAGVRVFIQISSAAAIASTSRPGEIVNDCTPSRPASPYGRSKLAADNALADLATDEFAVICVRPPAIYGPGVGAWFDLYARAARLGIPMPLGAIHNRRSFVFVDNVADGIVHACRNAVSGAFLLTDSEPVSSAELYQRLQILHGRSGRIWKVPAPVVRLVSRMLLRSRAASLLDDAAFSGQRFAQTFSWQPVASMQDGLQKTVRGVGA